jgi:hypothetical protein
MCAPWQLIITQVAQRNRAKGIVVNGALESHLCLIRGFGFMLLFETRWIEYSFTSMVGILPLVGAARPPTRPFGESDHLSRLTTM